MKLAISSYSFHRFGQGPETERPSIGQMLDRCVSYDVDGIELLGVHFSSTGTAELGEIKRAALQRGLQVCAVSAHHNFVTPDVEKRSAAIDTVRRWVDVAAFLGAPVVRVFGGRWQTTRDFAEFMAAGGSEPALSGFTDEDAFAWSIEAFRTAAAYAGDRGVTLGLENHWGLTGTAEGTLRIMHGVDSPWLRLILDTGNFLPGADIPAELGRLAPDAVMVHAKTYLGEGLMYTARTDMTEAVRTLRAVGYRGYLSLEFEGKAHPDQGIPAGLAELRKALG